MLVLTRRHQEAVVISGTNGLEQVVKVTVLDVRGSNVRLGFEASDEVPIHRAEIWDRICAERRISNPLQGAEQPRERPPYCD